MIRRHVPAPSPLSRSKRAKESAAVAARLGGAPGTSAAARGGARRATCASFLGQFSVENKKYARGARGVTGQGAYFQSVVVPVHGRTLHAGYDAPLARSLLRRLRPRISTRLRWVPTRALCSPFARRRARAPFCSTIPCAARPLRAVAGGPRRQGRAANVERLRVRLSPRGRADGRHARPGHLAGGGVRTALAGYSRLCDRPRRVWWKSYGGRTNGVLPRYCA